MKNQKYKDLVADLKGKKPEAVYCLLRDRVKILRETRGKSGVYCIINKTNGRRYVGSSVHLAKRLAYYLSINNSTVLPPARSAIYNSIKKYGLGNFILVIIETCEAESCIAQEQHYIDTLINMGKDYNLNPKAGSWLGFKHSPATLAKLTGRKRSAVTIKKIGDSLRGRKHSEATLALLRGLRRSQETKDKIGAASRGRKHSEATLAKLRGRKHSEAALVKIGERPCSELALAKLKGRVVSEETRAKLSAALTGRKLSEETRAKLSAIAKGRKASEATLAKLRGRVVSEETRAKLSDKKASAEARAKMRAVRLGKAHSEETRAKMRAAAAGKVGTGIAVTNVKTGEVQEFASIGKAVRALGFGLSMIKNRAESGALMGDAYVVKYMESAETRAKISAVRLGKTASEETRAKMRAAAAGKVGMEIVVTNVKTGETQEFASIGKAVRALGFSPFVIKSRAESGALLGDTCVVKYMESAETQAEKTASEETRAIIRAAAAGRVAMEIVVTNVKTGETQEFASIGKAVRDLGFSPFVIKSRAESGALMGDTYVVRFKDKS